MRPTFLSLFVYQTKQTKHLGLLIPFIAVQRRRAQFDELGPMAQRRHDFHSLNVPCGILKHVTTTMYK